ncbi:MAG: winged helix-turn-helix transcriptional regulator [Thaumarchaeota archaeon]|nr:winged helix-turn-helix transcriptional regulator [Nitrososphaerota archaeon]
MTEQNDDDILEISEKIEIVSTDDEKIKAIGELLSNDTSRKILKLLLENEMTANQISQKTDILLSLAIYHLKKMQEAEIVKIRVGKNTKKRDMIYYTTTKFAIIIVPTKISDKAKKSKTLMNSFRKLYQFAAIGIASITSYIVTQTVQFNQIPSGTRTPPGVESSEHVLWPIMIALIVSLSGLIIERVYFALKK